MRSVLAKPDWRRKILDPQIVAKWKVETNDTLRSEVFDYAMKEMEFLLELCDDKTGIQPSGVDLVWVSFFHELISHLSIAIYKLSDELVPDELDAKLKSTVEKFTESIKERDYHPNSNDQVLNIVHPSLFCLVYGKTTDYQGKVIKPADSESLTTIRRFRYPGQGFSPDERAMWSTQFHWLPAEFLVDDQGRVKIASYINSLPPSSGLYPILAEIFERIVPLFNTVLTSLRLHRKRIRFPRPNGYEWWEDAEPSEEIYEGLSQDDYDAREEKQVEWLEQREVNPLPIPDFDPDLYAVNPDSAVDLKGHKLQVIVKIGSVELSPEKPTFPGGNWHVEVSKHSLI